LSCLLSCLDRGAATISLVEVSGRRHLYSPQNMVQDTSNPQQGETDAPTYVSCPIFGPCMFRSPFFFLFSPFVLSPLSCLRSPGLCPALSPLPSSRTHTHAHTHTHNQPLNHMRLPAAGGKEPPPPPFTPPLALSSVSQVGQGKKRKRPKTPAAPVRMHPPSPPPVRPLPLPPKPDPTIR
jgi:hypothetical protein